MKLRSALPSLDKKIPVVDLYPQGSLTFSLGIHNTSQSLASLFLNEASLEEVMVSREEMDVIPADIRLADIEISLSQSEQRAFFLRNILSNLPHYDHILIDCPPSLSLLIINALTAADQVIIPLQMEVLSMKGLNQILQTVEKVNMESVIAYAPQSNGARDYMALASEIVNLHHN